MATAIINGITGQDGYYLSELLSSKGYCVIGLVRNSERCDKVLSDTVAGTQIDIWDMRDEQQLEKILLKYKPDEIYNLAAYTSGEGMFFDPVSIGEINGIAVVKILESIRKTDSSIKFCQASSREVFGLARETPQNESTVPNPRSPYGAAKYFADSIIKIYREHYNIFGCSAILYNHESPKRPLNFVTRKITNTAVKIKLKKADKLYLGNLDAERDWGFAGDYVYAMWLMMQNKKAADYVIASGKVHSIRDFCRIAFEYLDLDYSDYVVEDRSLFRPSEPVPLRGDFGKAEVDLNWKPKLEFSELVKMMVDYDFKILRENNILNN